MAYLGAQPNKTLTKTTSQSFNGTGSATVFTLNRAVNTEEELEVFVENVQQEPGSGKSYTASGTTLTFDEAPPSGTGNIYVIYRGLAEVTTRLEHDANQALSATTGTFSGAVSGTTGTFSGAVSGTNGTFSGNVSVTGDLDLSANTGAAKMAKGTTAQRPSTPAEGMFRLNTTTNEPEWYDADNTRWTPFADKGRSRYEAKLLVVGGGGGCTGNQYDDAAGAGGGGVVYERIKLLEGHSYSVVVGAGGSGGSNGGDSYLETESQEKRYYAFGGGYGGGHRNSSQSGGCGSGTGGFYANTDNRIPGAKMNGIGHAGGYSTSYRGAGGGGAGSEGLNEGTGGSGFVDPDSGTAYAAGGGGWPRNASSKLIGWGGHNGVGGNANTSTGSGDNGLAGRGGGAGGGKGSSNTSNGGSGVVIIRYSGSQKGTGGTVTTSGGDTIHTFTSSGTYTA